jgi:hypothetical protein
MAAPNDCSLCHTTANWNSTVLPSGHMPNPANQACALCHTGAPSNYAPLAANSVLHTGITSGCIACHGAPNAAAPVFYLNYTPKDAVLNPVHIPTAATPCESCHAVSFTSFSGTTMSAAKHTAMFAHIGGTCDACHNAVTPALSFYGVTNLTTRPSNHSSGSKKTSDCSSCHNPNNWNGGAATRTPVVKTAARSTVSAVATAPAATASVATASVATAPVAPAPAGSAKTAAAFALPLSHAGVTAHCASCHNGTLAAGKPPLHLPSNASCENCHATAAWLPARVEHRGISAACASCHNGVHASGKPLKHVQTAKDCGACHGVLAWTAATFDHLGVGGTCSSCHNGMLATGKQPQHLITGLDCGSCHGTLDWTVRRVPPAPHRSGTPVPRGANSTR